MIPVVSSETPAASSFPAIAVLLRSNDNARRGDSTSAFDPPKQAHSSRPNEAVSIF